MKIETNVKMDSTPDVKSVFIVPVQGKPGMLLINIELKTGATVNIEMSDDEAMQLKNGISQVQSPKVFIKF